MFEDFSFTSPSSSRLPRLALDDDRPMTDSDAMISPLSSRCPSPRSFAAPRFPRARSLYFRSPQHQQQPPTSDPFSAYDSHRLSIGTLTKKLHEHTIQNPEIPSSPTSPSSAAAVAGTPTNPRSQSQSYDSSRFPGYVLTPPDTDHSDDGYASPSPSSLSPQPQSPFLNPTSAPVAPLDIATPEDLQTYPEFSTDSIRTRRQHISRLQVQYTPTDIESIRRALLSATGVGIGSGMGIQPDDDLRNFDSDHRFPLTESCHPSSLSPSSQQGPRRKRTFSLRGSRVRSTISPDGPTYPSSHGHTSGAGEIQTRRKSISTSVTANTGSGNRIEKSYQTSSERERDRKKSEAGLRRKSMVTAALAEMIERGE
ncbi:hypothetical protein BJX70DRAFT_399150 [Aspergillus crustosus]